MMRLLVIDDSDGYREMLTELLEHQGYEVLGFEDPAPALATVDINTIDMILTDLVMPTSGERTIEELRGQGITIPIIVLTGFLEQKDVEHLIGIGATRVLEKPPKVSQLIASIELLLGEGLESDAAEKSAH